MEMCFLMVEKAPFGFCYDRFTWAAVAVPREGASGANAPDLVDSAPGPELFFAPGPELFFAPSRHRVELPS